MTIDKQPPGLPEHIDSARAGEISAAAQAGSMTPAEAEDSAAPTEEYAGWVRKTVIFLASQTVSLFGSTVVGFSIIWYITLQTSSGMMMTIATLCNFLPQILISLFAGVWADRYSRRLLIIIGDSCVAIFTLLLAITFIRGYDQIWLIFAVLALRSLFAGIQAPAVNALLPQIVPAGKLMRVNSLNTTIFSVMTLISPAVGGLVLGTLGFAYSLLVDTVTAVAAIAIISLLSVPRLKRRQADNTAFDDLKQGVRYVKGSQFLRYLLIFYAIGFFLISPAALLTPLLVERAFGPEVWMLTANEMAWSIGSVLGGIIVSVWGGFKNRIKSIAIAMLAWGFTFALLGLALNFWFYLTVMLVSGLFMPLFAAAETTLIQEKVEPEMMGRVFSLINIIISAIMPLGMLLFGPLADIVSVRSILVFSGVCMLLLSIPIFSRRILAMDQPPLEQPAALSISKET